MSTFVVGVDGGTTKTIALLADDRGRILAASRGGGSNWTGPDVEIPMAVVIATVQEALRHAGLNGDDIALAIFGLAGADWPEDHERRQIILARAGLARRVIVKNDSFVSLRAGTSQPYGVVIAAGTGVNAAAIAPDGREWAFGYYVDYGGGSYLGGEAMRAVLRAEDGRSQRTALTTAVLGKLGYPSLEAMLRARVAKEISQQRINALCPLLFAAAEAGDMVAGSIIAREGAILAEYATALIRRFGMQELEFDVVLNGGVFKGRGSLLVGTLAVAIERVAPRARIVRARYEPAVGGLLLAYDVLERVVGDEIHRNLAQTMPDARFFSTVDEDRASD
jgi:N-acetylglucosamine kinase-like BadF-type ATPase